MNKNIGWMVHHLEKLKAFSAVVRTGSIVTAAKELGVTQPGLSRLILNLEEASGKKLLERSRMGSKATPAGTVLHDFYIALEAQLADIETKVAVGKDAGLIKVGTFETFSVSWWPDFFKEFSLHHQIQIELQTIEGNSVESLISQRVFAIVEAVPAIHEMLTSEKISEDWFGVFKARKSKKQHDSLFYVPHATDNAGKRILDLVREEGLEFQSKHALSSFSGVAEFITSDLGLGVLPLRFAQKLVKRNQIEQVASVPRFGKHDICLSYLSENRSDPRIQILKKELKSFFKP